MDNNTAIILLLADRQREIEGLRAHVAHWSKRTPR
jgi:hypothetical protein